MKTNRRMFANNSANKDQQEPRRHSAGIMLTSLKSTCDAYHLDKNGHDAVVSKLVPKILSSIPPRVTTWRRNSTPKPFALSIFSNWNVGFSPINDSPDNSAYHSVQASIQLSKTSSRDSAFKSAQSVEKSSSGCTPSCEHQYESATEASSDFSIELMRKRRERVYDHDEDEMRASKRFRFSNLHGKPVKNLVEIFTAVEEGEITV